MVKVPSHKKCSKISYYYTSFTKKGKVSLSYLGLTRKQTDWFALLPKITDGFTQNRPADKTFRQSALSNNPKSSKGYFTILATDNFWATRVFQGKLIPYYM